MDCLNCERIKKIEEELAWCRSRPVYGCPNKISSGNKGFSKKVKLKLKDDGGLYSDLLAWLYKLEPNTEFTQTQIRNELGEKRTFGDAINKYLVHLCCLGIIQRIVFWNGSKGHKYKKLLKENPCKYIELRQNNKNKESQMFCSFDWTQAGFLGHVPKKTGDSE